MTIARRLLFVAGVVAAGVAGSFAGLRVAEAGPVATMIEQAKETGRERAAGEVSFLVVQQGLVQLANNSLAVDEALDILDAQAEPDEVLVGLLRGFALFNGDPVPATETRIESAFCSYRLSSNQFLSAEAERSIGIRCPKVPAACTCPP